MFMWNPLNHCPVGIRPVNCVLVKGFPKQDDLNQRIQLINVNAIMTQTESNSDVNKKDSIYTSRWNALFDKSFTQWIAFKPKENDMVYPCYSCRDMFSTKRSFLDHVNRRGMLIKYKCPHCPNKCPMTFYNPCALLLHTREHYSTVSGEIDLADVDISVVPTGLAGFFIHPDIPLLYDADEDNLGYKQPVNTKFYAPSVETEGNRIVVLKPLLLLFYQLATPTAESKRLILQQTSTNVPHCIFVKYIEPGGKEVNPPNMSCDEFVVKEEPIEIDEDYNDGTHSITEVLPTKKPNVNQNNFKPIKPKPPTTNPLTLPQPSYRLKSASCPECTETQKFKMVEHFLGANRPSEASMVCVQCGFIAPTFCSLNAHKRLHSASPPFVCPECGKDYPQYVQLMEHLDIVCFHLAKSVRFRCTAKQCNKIFANSESYITHFKLHLTELMQCTICLDIAKSEKWFRQMDPSHRCAENYRLVFRCTVCANENLLISDSFSQHLKFHCIDQAERIYVYMCGICKNYFRSRENYAVHVLKCQTVKTPNEGKSAGVPVLSGLKKMDTPKHIKVSYVFKCKHCNNMFSSHMIYITHLATCNKKTTTPDPEEVIINCSTCYGKFSMFEINNHISQCFPKQRKEKTDENPIKKIKISEVTSESNALIPEDDIKKESDDSVTTIESFGGEILEVQLLETPLEKGKKKLVKQQHEEFSLDELDESSENKRKRRKSVSPKSKKLLLETTDEPDLVQEVPVIFTGTYFCRWCEFSEIDRKVFHEHIKTHRDGVSAYQCMDCGECFVVKPSLVKHLNFVHQICDTEKYFEENDCFQNVLECEVFGENQCRVCRMEFSNKLELSKHFRQHGMAFMKSLK